MDDDPEQMKILDNIRKQYYGGSLMLRMRGEVRKQEKGPALIGLYNKITQRPPLPKGKNQKGRIKQVQNKIKQKPDSYFAGLTLKENPHETDLIDKIIEEGS